MQFKLVFTLLNIVSFDTLFPTDKLSAKLIPLRGFIIAQTEGLYLHTG